MLCIKQNHDKYFSDFEQHTIVDRAIFVETVLYMWKAGYAGYLGEASIGADAVKAKLEKIYDGSMLNDKEKLQKFLDSYNTGKAKKLNNDPALKLYDQSYALAYDATKLSAYRNAYAVNGEGIICR